MRSSHTSFADGLGQLLVLLIDGLQLAGRWASLQLLRALSLTRGAWSRRPR